MASIGLDRGWKGTNPMAGYYLESFSKLNGYDAHCVFDWEDDEHMLEAMKSDPLALAFSTTYVTDNEMLASCVSTLRRSRRHSADHRRWALHLEAAASNAPRRCP